MAANMDTTGTFEIAKCFSEHGLFVCIHKHYTVDEWVAFTKANPEILKNIAISSGTSDVDYEKLKVFTVARVRSRVMIGTL